MKNNSGITNIDEIVTTFLKAEEQNYSLYRYVDELGQENDHLTDMNGKLDSEINRYVELKRMNEKQKKSRVEDMRKYVKHLKSQINDAHAQMHDSREEFIDIQDMVEQMVHKFKVAQYNTKIASGMVYSDNT